MNRQWERKQLWIWELEQCAGGDVAAIIATAGEMGLSGLIVKAWDGSNYWGQIERIIAPAREAGLVVGAWGYSYGRNIQGEIQAMQRAVAAGCDWLVIDAEIEYESDAGRTEAASLFDALEATMLAGTVVGYTSFAFPEYHPQLPYDIFSKYCQVALPQVYWGEMKMAPDASLQRCLSEHQRFGLPVAPVGQCYGTVTPDEIQSFGAAAVDAGLPGISFWSWQHATSALFKAIKEVSLLAPERPSDWAKTAWEKAVDKGIMDGAHPQGAVTREMLAVILDKLKLL